MTLAAQNALLSLVMHHSRVSTAPSEAYSAGTAVLMVELLKGVISFMIAYLRVESVTAYNLPSNAPTSRSNPFSRLRKLGKEIFKSDCWKLSIPAILYGQYRTYLRVEEGRTLKDGCAHISYPEQLAVYRR